MSNPSLLCVPYRFKTSKLYSQIPDSGLGDFVVTRSASNSATRVNAAGLIETVADNVPRLDYPLGGITAGCPALLVEPSAQNFFFPSDDFANGITAPSSFGLNNFGSGSVSNTTATLDPFGTNLADYIQENATASIEHRALFTGRSGMVSGTTYIASIFAKSAQRTRFRLYNNAGGGGNVSFNLSNGTITAQSGIPAGASPRIENYGNGWFRCSVPFTPTASGNFNVIGGLLDASGNATYNGTGTDGLYIFGLQIELGSVATSYIPTAASPVTRGAETISKTGVSSLIGQTQGTFYLDITYSLRGASTGNRWIEISGPSNNIGLAVAASHIVRSIVNSSSDILATPSTASGVKIAWGYDGSGVVLFVNGTQYTLTNGGAQLITALDKVLIDLSSTPGTRIVNARIRAVTLYPTRLPNTGPLSLQSLTQ